MVTHFVKAKPYSQSQAFDVNTEEQNQPVTFLYQPVPLWPFADQSRSIIFQSIDGVASISMF